MVSAVQLHQLVYLSEPEVQVHTGHTQQNQRTERLAQDGLVQCVEVHQSTVKKTLQQI